MKAFIVASLLVVAVSASLGEHGTKFLAFKEKHGKTYLNAAEEVKRFNIFSDNLKSIEEHNARYEQGLETYKQGVTKFADMTLAEFKSMLALQKSSKPQINGTLYEAPADFEAPTSVDWRSKNVVTGIKDQGQCGGCWAFSLTGSTEGAYAIKTGDLVSLSEQQLIDCTTNINYGCDGGYLEQTWPYVERNGLQKESDYPFTGYDGRCKFSASKVVTKVSGYGLASGDENGKLLNAVAQKGPVSVAIDASYIQFYESGVYSSNQCSPDSLNHGVLIVGYGAQGGKNYWIVKNSWGSDWGDKGYILFLRGHNMCGIGEDTTYPTI